MSAPTIEPPVYLALAPCGCVKAAIVDPDHDARAAAELAWAKQHYTIRAVEGEWTELNLRLECPKCTEGGIYGPR